MSSFSAVPTTDPTPGNTSPTVGETPAASSTHRSVLDLLQLEHDIVDYTERLYEAATSDRDRDREIRQTTRAIDFIEGRQWSPNARYARNRPVLNKVRRHFWEQVGLLSDLSLDFTVKLFNKLNDYSDFERLLNELSVHWAQSNGFSDRLYDIILYGLLHTGPAKIQWNSSLAGGMGDVQLIPVAPWQWATMGTGSYIQDSECVLFFPVITQDHIARRFGKALASRVECDMAYTGSLVGQFKRPPHIDKASWNKMGDGLRVSLGIQRSTSGNDAVYPMALCKEFWLRDDSKNESSSTVIVGNPRCNWSYRVEPGEPLYPRGRVIVTAGGVVLEDSPNPYWHSKFPFSVFRPFRVPWKMSGDSPLRSWMQMNSVINTIMGGMLDYLNSVNEPTLIAPKGAFPAGDWDALDPGAPGGKIKYNNNAPTAPQFAKRAENPSAANLQYVSVVERELDMSSGASAMSQALGKKQVPGGDSLEMILNSRSLPVRVESNALASFIEDGGQMVIADMLQFYSVSHRMAILGSKGFSASDYRPIYGESVLAGMKPEEFVRKFQGIVRRDTLLRSQRAEKITAAFTLLKMGKISDRGFFRIVDDNFDYERNRLELLDEAKMRLMVAAAAQALSGKGKK